MKNISLFASLYTSFLLGSSAFSATQCETKFHSRGDGWQASQSALNSCVDEFNRASGQQKEYYANLVGRLSIYMGGMLEGQDKSDRRKVLEACKDHMDELSESSPTHNYWRLSCIAMRGKIASGKIDKAVWIRKFQKSIDNAVNVMNHGGDQLEAGGIPRALAAVYSNIKAKNPFFPLYKPEVAYEYSVRAKNMPGSVFEPSLPGSTAEELTGEDYIENWYYVGQSLVARGMKNGDRNLVEEGRAELAAALEKLAENRELGVGVARAPETAWYEHKVKESQALLDRCLPQNNWNKCLEEEMERD